MSEQTGWGRAALAALIGGALIGLAPIAIRISEIGPHATNLWRFLFALPILGAWMGLTRPIPTGGQTLLLLGAGLLFGIEISLWAAALGLTTVANATLLVNLTPVFAAVLGWLLFKERLSFSTLGGASTAFVGAIVLALARAHAADTPAQDMPHGWIGDSFALIGATFYAAYFLILRGLGRSLSVGAVMFWVTLAAAAVSAVLAFTLGEVMVPQTWFGWALVIGLGVVVQIGGQGLIAYGVARLPLAVSTVLTWTQPLVAAALSWIMFGEALGPLAFVGAVLILAGIYIVQRARAVEAKT